MSSQLLAVYVCIGLAVLFVVRATFRVWSAPKPGGCGSGCGKCATPVPETKPTKRVGLPVVK